LTGYGKISQLERALLAPDRVAATFRLKGFSRDLAPRPLIESIFIPALDRIGIHFRAVSWF
jgi:hypothetical protein